MAINEELDFLVSRVAKVRKWLAAIAILKTAAICMLFACIYIGSYILLDHRFNFGLVGRLIALIFLIGSSIFLIYKLSRLLLVEISYTNAANFIENNYSLNQQLVAAIEYYENKADYPYSKVLAEQLILRVNKDSESFQYDSVIEKWRGYALAAFVSIGLCVVSLYVINNISFLKTYFARLAVPFAPVAPISATSLELISGDIVSEPESMLTFSAKIKGRVPDSGQLLISPVGQDSNDQTIQLRPVEKDESEPIFETSEFFPNTGQYKYQFVSGQAQTQWQNIDIREAPRITSITAEIQLPNNVNDENTEKFYSEQIKNNTIEIIKNSSVTLHIESSSNLSEIELIEPSGNSNKMELNSENKFTHTFTANDEGNIEFNLTDEKGMKSQNIPDLKIILKTDNPPEFELISPDGDYLATNVSSVPIEFKITDDFGLSSAKFIAEFPDGTPISIDIPIQPDSNEASFTHMFELEQYNMQIGDSIMFYANATDIKTTISNEENAASSEIYFIEIRPYQQIWNLNSGGGQGNPSAVPEDLLTLLEYTRSLIKKTSVLDGKNNLDSDDHAQARAINEDVEYCSALTVRLRDDPQSEFTDTQIAIFNEVLSYFNNVSRAFGRYDIENALVNEKHAYRILRKVILELEKDYNPPQQGETIPTETPDKTPLLEATETPEIEESQIEEVIEDVQKDIENIKEEQILLKDQLEEVLEVQKEANQQALAKAIEQQMLSNNNTGNNSSNTSQPTESNSGDGGSSNKGEESNQSSDSSGSSGSGNQGEESSQPSSGSGSSGSGNQGEESSQPSSGSGSSGSGNQGEESSQPSSGSGSSGSGNQGEESSQPSSGSGSGGSGNQGEESSQPSSGSGSGGSGNQGEESNQASNGSGSDGDGKQSEESSQPSNSSGEGSGNSGENPSEKSPAQSIAEAQINMLKAKQSQLQDEVFQIQKKLESISKNSEGEMSQASQNAHNNLGKALDDMEKFQHKMDELEYQPQEYDKKAQQALDMMDSAAEKLDTADKSLGKVLSGNKEKQLAKELKENSEMLSGDPDMLEGEFTNLEKERLERLRESALNLLKRNVEAQESAGSGSPSNFSTGTLVFTKDSGAKDRDFAREIAREFMFLAFQLEQRKEQPIEAEPSDSRFNEIENNFFENAAEYNTE